MKLAYNSPGSTSWQKREPGASGHQPRFWLLLLLLGVQLAAAAQPGRKALRGQALIDSLWTVARQHPHDSTGSWATIRIAELWRARSPDSSIAWARRSLAVTRPYPRQVVLSHNLIALAYYYRGDYAPAYTAFDSAYVLARRYNNARQMGEMKNNMASIRLEQGDYAAALALYREALAIQRRARQTSPAIMALGNIGYVYKEIGDYDRALAIFFETLRQYEEMLKSPTLTGMNRGLTRESIAAITEYIGETYKRLGNWVQARYYFEKNLRYYEQAIIREGTARTLRALAAVNSADGRPAEARIQLLRALALHEAAHDAMEIAAAHTELAELAVKEGQPAVAVHEYETAVTLARRIRNVRIQTMALIGLAGAQVQRGQLGPARAVLDSASLYARRLASKPQLADYYRVESQYAEKTGNARAALASFRLATVYKDSILTAEKAKAIADAGTKYETEKKEARNRLQAARLRTQQQVIRRRNVQLWAGLAVAGLLAGLAYLLYNRRRLRREVEFAQERQQLTQLRAAAVLEAEEAERRRIGADLHDGVGQLLTAARMNLAALGENLAPQTTGQQVLLQNALDVVDESFREVRSISHNLMPNALIKRGLAQAVRDFINKISPDGRLRVQLEVVGLDQGGRLPPTMENVLFRVIQELVQNIVKHARATQVTLQLLRRPDELTVMVEDNGVGFDPAALGPEAGIGLRNIETRMAYLGGRADFDSSPGRGTTVTLELPLLAEA